MSASREVLFEGDSPYQHVLIQDAECFGRSLVLDDKTQSTELDEFVYHEALVQPALIAHPNPRTVFIAGGGEGATAREALRHRSVERVVMVDLDELVVNMCKKYLPNHHQGAFDDPRMKLLHEDALRYIETTDERFDVAIIDVPDPLEAGPAYLLFTQEFYRSMRSRLNPGGIMVAQSGPTGATFYEQCFSRRGEHGRLGLSLGAPERGVHPVVRHDMGLRDGDARRRYYLTHRSRDRQAHRRAHHGRATQLRRDRAPGDVRRAEVPSRGGGGGDAGDHAGGSRCLWCRR